MSTRNYNELLHGQWAQKKFLCVGLDPDIDKIPEVVQGTNAYETIVGFNKAIIDATQTFVGGYKPNSAFYEAHGEEGLRALRDTISYINDVAPTIPVILDAKRADIGNTNTGYVQFAFEYLHADAITVHPYLGREALQPFLDQKDKGIIILCRTSNKGAGEFQDVLVDGPSIPIGTREPLYLKVARNILHDWNANNNCSVVVGATYLEELRAVRSVIGDMPILIPGIGTQGGDAETTVRAGKNSRGEGMIISASRSIIYASSGADFAGAAQRESQRLDAQIRAAL